MTQRLDHRRAQAMRRFAEFFTELKGAFREREDVLDQVALALLAREHVLMTGPPGTAKSQLSSAVVGRIRCEQSGQPSLFSRQFTESTVQTDLIGPVNFKTLTETGRTEHFTDEGMLGAVHAFLDEVLDGRDMLLRSTLNVLEERELKQGTRVTKGAIECALMTSNRYLAEVLQDSRETLLAFVDRIAFVNFVPRGFARSESLDAVLAGTVGAHRQPLRAPLSIQDLDVLQAMVEQVEVPAHVLTQLRELVESFEREQRLAERADPHFVPTRYLSTRTVVRLGKLLRAICVFDKANHRPERALRVELDDLGLLRLSLLLAGPRTADIEALIERESDPRERRQLKVMAREHELFAQCLRKLTLRHPSPDPARPAGDEHGAESGAPRRTVRDTQPEFEALGATDTDTEGTDGDAAAVHEAEREAEQRGLQLVAESAAALRAGWLASGADDALHVAQDLAARADALTSTEAVGEATSNTALARWLRRRALRELVVGVQMANEPGGPSPSGPTSTAEALRVSRERIARMQRALALREELRARLGAHGTASGTGTHRAASAGRDPGHAARASAGRDPENATHEPTSGAAFDPEGDGDSAFRAGLGRLREALRLWWDAALRTRVQETTGAAERDDLGAVLDALDAVRAPLDALDHELGALEQAASGPDDGAPREAFGITVAGPRLRPLVRAAYGRLQLADRRALVTRVRELVTRLDKLALGEAVGIDEHLAWAAEALLRTETRTPSIPPITDLSGYRELRRHEAKSAASAVLAEVALVLLEAEGLRAGATLDPADVSACFETQPEETARALGLSDLARVERAMDALELWWTNAKGRGAVLPSELSGVLLDERALQRFWLECRLTGQVFPAVRAEASALEERIVALKGALSDAVVAHERAQSERAWDALLASIGDAPTTDERH